MKNKVLIIILIVLTLLLCGSIAYIAYDKMNTESLGTSNSKKSVDDKKSKEQTTIDLEEKDVSSFIRKIDTINTYMPSLYPINDIKEVQNSEILKMSRAIATSGIGGNGIAKNIDGDKIANTIVEYFGSDYQYKLENIECFAGDGVLYTYNENNNNYSFTGTHGHDGQEYYRNKAFFQNATYDKENETYTISTKIVSAEKCGGTCGPRIQFYGGFNFDEILLTTDSDTEYSTAYNQIDDKVPVTTYVFSKNTGGDYALKSVKIG